ncbi:MAG: hypothetical protein J3R72DRAFT_526187 [Linnemannia gamsii]|nr:MAG: hypothetical protein J3R72DRAFT_526187 [Linnemannia gamsii]
MTIHDIPPSVQAVRCVYENGQPVTGSPSDIVHLTCHPDDSIGRDILLWDDILAAFKDDVIHVRLGTRVLPFVKGANFKNLDPLRIVAIPGASLDVVVRGQLNAKDMSVETLQNALPITLQEGNSVANPNTPTSTITTANTVKRNPAGGLVEAAMENYTHMENPATAPKLRGPQSLPSQETPTAVERTEPHPVPSLAQASAPQEYTVTTVATNNSIRKDSDLFSQMMVKARSGDKDAQVSIAEMYTKGRGVSQDYEAAMDWFLKAANQGDAGAQCNVAYMHENGNGAPRDYSKAMHWYLKSANQGNASALCNIGYFYDCGYGVDQDYSKAMEWYLKAASQGLARAQYSIGYLYQYGQGVPQDYNAAMTWFLKAATKKLVMAQSSIGNLYFYGQGVPQDYSQAMDWYINAADQGYVNAQYNIGLLYYSGLGVPQDYPKALEWFQKAADQGHANGKEYVDDVMQRIKDSFKPDVDAGTATRRSKENIKSPGIFRSLSNQRERIFSVRSSNPSDIILFACHLDPSLDKDIVLWDDIIDTLKANVVHVRSGTFLDPPRIAAIPGTTLDAVVRNHFGEQELSIWSRQKALPTTTQEPSPVTRSNTQRWRPSSVTRMLSTLLDRCTATVLGLPRISPKPYEIGCIYGSGQGVPRSYTEAVDWYQKSAKQGYANAQSNIGSLYSTVEVCRKTTFRLWNGFSNLQTKGSPHPSATLARFMAKA